MLKTFVIENCTERRLVLEGKVIAPWVAELRTAVQAARVDLAGRQLVIDLANVPVISQEGENVLLGLMNGGANFRCRSLLTRGVVQQLMRRSEATGSLSGVQ